MVTDQQVRRLFMFIGKKENKEVAAAKAGMSPRTALKYRKAGKLPSQIKSNHNWRTRENSFETDWPQIVGFLEINPGLEAKTLFNYLQNMAPGKYSDGQLRTLQRHIRYWRATEGPGKEVFFSQVHYPGIICASDFTHMSSLGVTIRRELFKHLVYHFVLTYSNWETFSICYSESYESLSDGFQKAIWKLGGVPKRHRSDQMSAAVNKDCNPEKFTRRYQALLNHYGITPERTNAGCANENGDVETSHRHFKSAVSQSLMLRGSSDFGSIKEYEKFLQKISCQLNAGRVKRFQEEVSVLKPLPARRLNDSLPMETKVSKGSTINVKFNTYSVHSRLIGEKVKLMVHMDHIDVWYGKKLVEHLPRMQGRGKHSINYRHIIGWLIRKPGAFESHRYKSDLFPSSRFRRTYDWLRSNMTLQANKEYLQILFMAARESETITENALKFLFEQELPPTASNVRDIVDGDMQTPLATEVTVNTNDLKGYDLLLHGGQSRG
jgi:hypothetical protein